VTVQQLGPYALDQVHQADAYLALRALPDACLDGIVTDPPYSSGGLYRGDRLRPPGKKYRTDEAQLHRPEFAGDARDGRSYLAWCVLWLTESRRACRDGSPAVVFADWRQLPTVTDALQAAGWVWRGIAVWDKGEGARPQPGRFRQQAEFVVWGSRGALRVDDPPAYLPGVVCRPLRPGDKLHHPAGKPVEVLRWLVEVVPAGGIVCDPFAGAATTGVAALGQGRRFLGFELLEYYVALGNERLRAAADGQILPAREGGQLPLLPADAGEGGACEPPA
jgi:site-specific DNA-methyltransferase (adenine-specific)